MKSTAIYPALLTDLREAFALSRDWALAVSLGLASVSVCAQRLPAQASTATITGVVQRKGGDPIARVRITIDGGRDTATTEPDGRFVLRVTSNVAGVLRATTPVDTSVISFPPLKAGATREVDVVMPGGVASRSEESRSLAPVIVTADREHIVQVRPLLDTAAAVTGGTVSAAELRSLPVADRDPLTLAFTIPGAAQATGFFNTAPILSLNGQNSLYTQYLIDGFDNNEGVLGGPRVDLPLSAIRLLDIRSSTYDVTSGRSSNGIVNEETMRGSDAWHGDGFVYDHPGKSFDARQAVLPPNTSAGFRRIQAGGALGGPVITGRTFVFAAAERLAELQDQPIVITYGSGTGSMKREKTKAFLRLDQKWNDHQSTTFHVAYSDVQYIGRGGGNVTPEADVTQHRTGALIAAEHESVLRVGLPSTFTNTFTNTLTNRLTNKFGVQVATFHWYYPPTTSALDTPQIVILSRGLDSTLAIVGSSGFQYDSHERQINLRDEIEQHWLKHDVRIGADMISGQFNLHGDGTNLAGTYSVIDSGQISVRGRVPSAADIPASIPVYSFAIDAAPQVIRASQTVVGAYAQDSWSATGRLRVIYGVRWDYDDITSHGGSSPDLTNVQPRASFNWQHSPQTIIRGGAGIYSGKLPYTIYSDALQFGANGSAHSTFYNSAATPLSLGHAPSAASLASARQLLPPREIRSVFALGIRSPRSYQSSTGFQHAFGANWGVSADVVYVQTVHLPRLYDLNAVTREVGPSDTTNQAVSIGDRFRPVTPRAGSFRQNTTTETNGRSWYAGMFLTLRHDFTSSFSGDASYVLSHARDNTEDINFAASNGNNDFGKEWGDAVNDRRHKLNVRGRFAWSRRLQLTGVLDFQTGQPINRVSGLDLTGSGGSFGDGFIRNTQRYYGVPRNGERLPYALEFNPGFSYSVPAGTGEIKLRVDAFNVLNRANFSGFPSGIVSLDPRTQVGRPGDPIVYQLSGRPRQIQFAAEYGF